MVGIGAFGAGFGGRFGMTMAAIGCALFTMVVLFQIINLPVEFDASKRAKNLLRSAGIVREGQEYNAMRKVLSAAALTYVAGALASLLNLWRWLRLGR